MSHYLFTSSAEKDGGVFLLDGRAAQPRRIVIGPFRGLTRGPCGDYYAVSGYRNPSVNTSTIHRIRAGSWESEPVIELPVKDTHDFRWIDGHFYLIASVGNQILRLDERCRLVDRMQIVEDDRDICHLNSIEAGARGLLCSIFTLSPGERKEKRKRPEWFYEGKLLQVDFDARSYEIVYEPLFQPHSLHRRDDAVYLVESHRSCVTRVDLRSRTSRVLSQYSGFVRGLSVHADEAAVGVCTMYARDRKRLRPLPWLKQWLERRFPFSGILILDPKSWRVRRRVRVPGAEPYDILRLDDADHGSGRAVPCSG